MERQNLLIILVCFLIIPVVFFNTIAFSQDNMTWKLEKDANNIKCYTRIVQGSDFKEYKAVTEIKSTLSGLVALIEDMENAPEWIDTCIEGSVLKRLSPKETITYSANGAPWPVDDRDAVVYNRISQEPVTKQVTIELKGKSDYIDEISDRVRIKKLTGFWQLTPKSNDRVEVHYQVHCEPGGNLPSWLVNSVVVDQPYKTLFNMKDYVQKKKYQDKNYGFIEEMF